MPSIPTQSGSRTQPLESSTCGSQSNHEIAEAITKNETIFLIGCPVFIDCLPSRQL